LLAFIDAGNTFAIGTGRALSNVLAMKKELGLTMPGIPVIAYNGVQIYDADRDFLIFDDFLDPETVSKVMDIARELKLHCHTYQEEKVVATEWDEPLEAYLSVVKMPYLITDDLKGVIEKGPFPKLMLCVELKKPEKLLEMKQCLEEKVPEVVAFLSNREYLDIFPAGTDKGRALRILGEYLGVPEEEILAAGDAENDAPMLKAAGFSIAMKNADQALKKGSGLCDGAGQRS